MGRRSINTTKSGKYMNPTDQARKEARKKELKKNKKQRQMVRAAVLKGKDPAQILEEMEKIDEMEYNVYQPSPLNEKVLREKRKKLKETFDRVMRLYHNDDPELWAELKRKEVEYEKRRLKKQQYYESVKHAQTVQVDEIPLPQMNIAPSTQFPRIPAPNALPVPPFTTGPPTSILKKLSEMLIKPEEKPLENKKNEPPGCPPGPPPDLLQMRELDSDYEDDEQYKPKKNKSIRFSDDVKENRQSNKEIEESKLTQRKVNTADSGDIVKPTSLQQRMLAISGQNIDDFMKEMENVHKKKEQEKESENGKHSSAEEDDASDASYSEKDDKEIDEQEDEDDDEEDDKDSDDSDEEKEEVETNIQVEKKMPEPQIPLPPAPPTHSITLPSGPPPPPIGLPPAMLFRPPPLRPGMPGLAIRMPPGPPPGRPGMPPGPPSGLPPRLGIRMPPGPPPGLPPARLMHHHNQKGQINNINNQVKGITTITAKPQIRNLSADVTRFVPSTLRVKREDKQKPKPKPHTHEFKQIETNKGATKDDAYMQFMREMQGLL